MKAGRKIKFALIFGLLMLFFWVAIVALFKSSRVQTAVAKIATSYLSDEFGTEVSLERLNIDIFSRISIHRFLIRDSDSDTLIYANKLKVSIRSFRPIKRKLLLKRLELDGAYIHLEKKIDERSFNIETIFGGTESPEEVGRTDQIEFIDSILGDENSVPTNNTKPWEFDLDELHLTNVFFWLDDQYKANDLKAKINNSTFELNDLGLKSGTLDISRAEIECAHVSLVKSEKGPDHYNKDLDPKKKNKEDHILTTEFKIQFGEVRLTDSEFLMRNFGKPLKGQGIEFSDLAVSDIDLWAQDGKIEYDTITADINHLSCSEKSGLQVERLSTLAWVSTRGIVLDSLDLNTGNSRIRDFLSFRYKSFKAFDDFESQVKMKGNFVQSEIDFRDLAYFVPKLAEVSHNRASLNGMLKGTVDNLRGRNFSLYAGKSTAFRGDLTLIGLPNIQETFIDLKAKSVKTNHSDLQKIYPQVKIPAQVANLGEVSFSGRFTGFVNDFVTDGQFKSELGEVNTNLNMKINESGLARYRGDIAMSQFELGKLLEQEELIGALTFQAGIKGQGLKLEELDASLDGNFQSIVLKGYTYRNLSVDGAFKKRLFTGALAIEDEHLALNFDGIIDLNSDLPKFKLAADVRHADLAQLNLVSDSFQLSTQLNLDFFGNNFDNVGGYIGMSNTVIKKGSELFKLDSLSLYSDLLAVNRSLRVNSDILDAHFSGDFSFDELPKAFRYVMNEYVKGSVWKANNDFIDQHVEFDINISNTRNLTHLISPDLHKIKGAEISGKLDSRTNLVDLDLYVPRLKFKDFDFRHIVVNSSTWNDELHTRTEIYRVIKSDSVLAKQINLLANSDKEEVEFLLALRGDTIANRSKLEGVLSANLDSLDMRFKPSELVVWNEVWSFNPNNHLKFLPGQLNLTNMDLLNGSNKVSFITSQPDANVTDLSVEANNIALSTFSKLISRSGPRLEGDLSTIFTVQNLFGDKSYRGGVKIAELSINSDTLGELRIDGRFTDPNAGRLSAKQLSYLFSGSLKGEINDLTFGGTIANENDNQLDISSNIKKLDLKFLNHFLDRYVTEIAGTGYGDLKLSGSLKKPQLTGDLRLKDTELRVAYILTKYAIKDEVIHLEPNFISLNGLRIFDHKGHQADVTGGITHNYLKDFELGVNVSANKFQFLNTRYKDNQDFYGKAYASGVVNFTGPFKHILIEAEVSTEKETSLSIPLESEGQSKEYSFYHFVQPKKDTVSTSIEKKKKGKVSVSFDLDINDLAEIELIFNQESGDVVKARGDGNIRLEVNEFGDLNVYGTYEITDGDYLFTLQNLINKKFKISRGSKINFTGDVEEAVLELDAIYSLRSSTQDLIYEYVAEQEEALNKSKKRVPVELYLNVDGFLYNPTISFDIKVKDVDPAIKTSVENKLLVLNNNASALNKQVFGLLVMNRFLPTYDNADINSASPVLLGGSVNNTVSEFLSNQLSNYLSDWISSFVTDIDLDIRYSAYDADFGDGTGSIDQLDKRRELQILLTRKFFNDRVTIIAGGNIDFGENSTPSEELERNTYFAGDFQFEYSITADGRLRVKAFSKGDYDIFDQSNINKAGLGISFRQEYDTIKELFQRKKKKKQEIKANNPPEAKIEED